jgi:hypothetical protein
MSRFVSSPNELRAFLGSRWRCGEAGGDCMGDTGPERTVPRAASVVGGAGLRPVGPGDGEERA